MERVSIGIPVPTFLKTRSGVSAEKILLGNRRGEPRVVLDESRDEFVQALLNILNNARDAFRERGTDDPRVTITICTEGDRSVVTISDNAGGIPEEIMGKIFDPYFTTKGPQQGTGIGLFMSKAIIEKNMGGRLTVRNTGQGAEFRIEV